MATKLILSLQHREAVLLWGVDFVVAKPGGSVYRREVDFVIAKSGAVLSQ